MQSQSKDDDASKLHFQIEELKEQNEVLEFRTLELEEQVEKVRTPSAASSSLPPSSLSTLRFEYEAATWKWCQWIVTTADVVDTVTSATLDALCDLSFNNCSLHCRPLFVA